MQNGRGTTLMIGMYCRALLGELRGVEYIALHIVAPVSADPECRSQPKFEDRHSIHCFHEMVWALLRSRSFFLHSYLSFPGRESGYQHSVFVGASGVSVVA